MGATQKRKRPRPICGGGGGGSSFRGHRNRIGSPTCCLSADGKGAESSRETAHTMDEAGRTWETARRRRPSSPGHPELDFDPRAESLNFRRIFAKGCPGDYTRVTRRPVQLGPPPRGPVRSFARQFLAGLGRAVDMATARIQGIHVRESVAGTTPPSSVPPPRVGCTQTKLYSLAIRNAEGAFRSARPVPSLAEENARGRTSFADRRFRVLLSAAPSNSPSRDMARCLSSRGWSGTRVRC